MSLSDLEALEHVGVMLSYLNLREISVSQPKYTCIYSSIHYLLCIVNSLHFFLSSVWCFTEVLLAAIEVNKSDILFSITTFSGLAWEMMHVFMLYYSFIYLSVKTVLACKGPLLHNLHPFQYS